MGGLSSFRKTKLFRVLTVGALLCLLAWWSPGWIIGPARAVFLPIALPLQGILYPIASRLDNVRSFLISIGDLKQENERLIHENTTLVAESASLREVRKENEMLRRELDLLPRSDFDLESADVIEQDPLNLGSWLVIDKGSADGLAPGMSVIVDQGVLVGRLDEVSTHASRVVLLTAPESVINGSDVQTDARGVVRGRHGLGLLLDMVVQTDTLNDGDDVVTSGLGGDVPRGFLIGKIQEVRLSDDRLFRQAVVISPLKFDRLRTVFVVKGDRRN